MKTAIVCGAGGFIGGHLVNRLKEEGYWVRGVDLKENEYGNNPADAFTSGDLRDPVICEGLFDREIDEVYQLAADMGGAGYIIRGRNSDNRLIREKLGWSPSQPLVRGLTKTYEWIKSQIASL